MSSMKDITCIADLRALAKRRVPRAFFDYADAGSYAEETLRANRADLEKVKLRQRVLIDVDKRDLSTTIVGQKASLPLALAPIGICGMQHGDGEILAARAANEAGIPFCLSTMSICSIEDVAEATGKPFWFQLYVMRDRGFIKDLIARAKECEMLGAGAHRRPADPRPAPSRHQERPDGAAGNPHQEHHRYRDQAALGLERAQRAPKDIRKSRRPCARHGERQFAVDLDREPVRSDAELEGRGMGAEAVARQAHPQGHSRSGRCKARGQDRRRRHHRVQSRRPAARRHLVVDLDAAESGRRRRLADRDHVRRRRAHRARHPARARARREELHDRPRLYLGPRRRRAGRALRKRSTSCARSSTSTWRCAA